jgi:hypothetical protein
MKKMVSKCLISFYWFNAGSENLTAVVTKNSIFWDITPCCPLKVNILWRGA